MPSRLAPNRLDRTFTVAAPNRAWVTDITYIRTWQGWLYLAAVMDLYSRKIVGWSLKRERVNRRNYKTVAEAHADVFGYVEVFDNRKRRDSHLGDICPEAFEKASTVAF